MRLRALIAAGVTCLVAPATRPRSTSTRPSGRRASTTSVNWVMGMARRPLARGQLRARAMLSLEPATVGRCGYPDLLATGELCRGDRLVDRQHPHDLFMELAAGWARALGRRLSIDLYAAAAGEPALGPTAYPLRLSAMASPIAPITHHWVDSAAPAEVEAAYGSRWPVGFVVFANVRPGPMSRHR